MDPNTWNNIKVELFGGNHTLDAITTLLADDEVSNETKKMFKTRDCVVYYNLTDAEMLLVCQLMFNI